MSEIDETRRTLLSFGAVALIAGGSVPAYASAASGALQSPLSSRTNEDVVRQFIAAFNDRNKMASLLSENAIVRMVENQPAVIGPQAYLEEAKRLAPGYNYVAKIRALFSAGPVVVCVRTDTQSAAGKRDTEFEIVSTFVVRDGKITEWSDYLLE